MLRHVNEDHVVPELQFLERLYRLMVAAEAMHSERRLAARSCVTNGLVGGLGAIPVFSVSPLSASAARDI